MDNFWKVVGVLLFIWVAYDLYAGFTILYDVIYRDQQPGLYWITIGIWTVLAISCFFSWSSDGEDIE